MNPEPNPSTREAQVPTTDWNITEMSSFLAGTYRDLPGIGEGRA